MRFHVNIDHVATLRNARGTAYPDPIRLASLCEEAGADGITAHLREDRRHIRDDDLRRLRQSVRTCLNLEMAAVPEITGIAEQVGPDVITLVPERREERTTEGGLDVVAQRDAIQAVATMCRRRHIRLSLFIGPEREQILASHALGVQQIELHTGEYCNASGTAQEQELGRLRDAARLAGSMGLAVAAGHGLTRQNLPLVVAIPEVEELNIGHAVISDAVELGMAQAVRAFREAVAEGLRRRG